MERRQNCTLRLSTERELGQADRKRQGTFRRHEGDTEHGTVDGSTSEDGGLPGSSETM